SSGKAENGNGRCAGADRGCRQYSARHLPRDTGRAPTATATRPVTQEYSTSMRWAFNPIALARLAIGGGQGRSHPWPVSWADVEDLFATAYKADVRAVFYGSGDAPALIDLLRRAADE